MTTAAVPLRRVGVEILGTGSCLPEHVVTNADLEGVMETSDEWIVQRTGIRERRMINADLGETTTSMATAAARRAIERANIAVKEIDLIVVATMTPDSPTPSVSTLVGRDLGLEGTATFDINAACCGFVYSINVVHGLIQSGMFKTVLLIGSDALTRHIELTTYGRGTAILFGDASAAVVLRATDDTSKGLLAHSMHSDGSGARHLFVAARPSDFPDDVDFTERDIGLVYMNGKAVFKFAVSRFPELIEASLEATGLQASDIQHYICHQANARILESARDRFGLDEARLHINIDRVGNTVAASCPLVFDELNASGRIKPGDKAMFLAFGAGLTWAASLWQL